MTHSYALITVVALMYGTSLIGSSVIFTFALHAAIHESTAVFAAVLALHSCFARELPLITRTRRRNARYYHNLSLGCHCMTRGRNEERNKLDDYNQVVHGDDYYSMHSYVNTTLSPQPASNKPTSRNQHYF